MLHKILYHIVSVLGFRLDGKAIVFITRPEFSCADNRRHGWTSAKPLSASPLGSMQDRRISMTLAILKCLSCSGNSIYIEKRS